MEFIGDKYDTRMPELCETGQQHSGDSMHQILFRYVVRRRGIGSEFSYADVIDLLITNDFYLPTESSEELISIIDLELLRICDELEAAGNGVELVDMGMGTLAVAEIITATTKKQHVAKPAMTEITTPISPKIKCEPPTTKSQLVIDTQPSQPIDIKYESVISFVRDNNLVGRDSLIEHIREILEVDKRTAQHIISNLISYGLIHRANIGKGKKAKTMYTCDKGVITEISTLDDGDSTKNNQQVVTEDQIYQLEKLYIFLGNQSAKKTLSIRTITAALREVDPKLKTMDYQYAKNRVNVVVAMMIRAGILISMGGNEYQLASYETRTLLQDPSNFNLLLQQIQQSS